MTTPDQAASDRAPAAGAAVPANVLPARLDAAWFETALCRNCGQDRHALPYCAHCGQKQAHRLGLRDLGRETWEKWRLFEFAVARTAGRLLLAPGRVAREYVCGARSRHVHPLKLLLVCMALLALVLDRTAFMTSASSASSPVLASAMAMAQRFGNWSFALAIVSIVAATRLVFRGRGGFNLVEILVFAAYCHAAMIALHLLNLLPLLVPHDPEFLQAWKDASKWYMYALKCALLLVAWTQFFRLDARRDPWRLLLATAFFVAIDLLLRRAYAWLVIEIVLARLS